MNIVHIITSDHVGGAAIATKRLSDAMRTNGIDSQLVTFNSTPTWYSKIKYPILSRIYAKFQKKTTQEKGVFSIANLGYDVTKLAQVQNADMIYIHWTNALLSLRDIDKMCRLQKPVIIYMHDMWHITGGCHYSFECNGYKGICKDCPMFEQPSNLAQVQLKRKIKIFSKYENITVVCPSAWLGQCASESSVMRNKRVEVIPNCLDVNVFKPVDKAAARRFMNLPLDKKIICFGAHKGKANPYKGWSYLETALKELEGEDFAVLIFGSEYDQSIVDSLTFKVYFSSHLHDCASITLLYNAIDIFVIPSLAEAFGQVAVEAFACGAGVVGFDVGGITDIVKHKERGYLAHYKDSHDLAQGIKYMINHPQDYSTVAWVEANCSYDAVVNKHKPLWESLK